MSTVVSDLSNTFEAMYARGECIRRFPDEDVVALCARRRGFAVGLDLGTGSGRNLTPLLLAVREQGLVIASDLSPSGLNSVKAWLTQHGATLVNVEDLSGCARDTYVRLAIEIPHTILRLTRRRSPTLDPFNLTSAGEEEIFLILACASMESSWLAPGSVDLIINRGSIFYLTPPAMDVCLTVMRVILSSGGSCLVSFKSERDSRFRIEPAAGDDSRVRVQCHGPQSGLRLVFSGEPQVRSWMADFEDLQLSHIETALAGKDQTLADWVAIGRKPAA